MKLVAHVCWMKCLTPFDVTNQHCWNVAYIKVNNYYTCFSCWHMKTCTVNKNVVLSRGVSMLQDKFLSDLAFLAAEFWGGCTPPQNSAAKNSRQHLNFYLKLLFSQLLLWLVGLTSECNTKTLFICIDHLYDSSCWNTTRHVIHRVLGVISSRQWDAVRKRLWQKAFHPIYESGAGINTKLYLLILTVIPCTI